MWFVPLYSRVWFAFFEKDLRIQYSLQTLARRIVQSDFSILPCETVIFVRPRTTKTLLVAVYMVRARLQHLASLACTPDNNYE